MVIRYNFKYFLRRKAVVDYNPAGETETEFRPKEMMFGEANYIFKPSDYDPWQRLKS